MTTHIAEQVTVRRSESGVISITLDHGHASYVSQLRDGDAHRMAIEVFALVDALPPAVAPPRGVVAVMTDAEGRVMASASDFEEHGYGGYTLQEAQTLRVKHALADAIAVAYCSHVIIEGLEKSDRYKLVENLLRKDGFKRTLIPVGWPAEGS